MRPNIQTGAPARVYPFATILCKPVVFSFVGVAKIEKSSAHKIAQRRAKLHGGLTIATLVRK